MRLRELCHGLFLCQSEGGNTQAFVCASAGVEHLLLQSFACQRFGPIAPWWCDSSSIFIPNRATPGNNAVDVTSCGDLLFGMPLARISQIAKYHFHRHWGKQAPKFVICDPCNTLCNVHKVVIIAGSLGIKSKGPQLNFFTLPRRTAPKYMSILMIYVGEYMSFMAYIKVLQIFKPNRNTIMILKNLENFHKHSLTKDSLIEIQKLCNHHAFPVGLSTCPTQNLVQWRLWTQFIHTIRDKAPLSLHAGHDGRDESYLEHEDQIPWKTLVVCIDLIKSGQMRQKKVGVKLQKLLALHIISSCTNSFQRVGINAIIESFGHQLPEA